MEGFPMLDGSVLGPSEKIINRVSKSQDDNWLGKFL